MLVVTFQPGGSAARFDTSGGGKGDMGGSGAQARLSGSLAPPGSALIHGGLSQSGTVQNHTLGVGMSEANKGVMGVIPVSVVCELVH